MNVSRTVVSAGQAVAVLVKHRLYMAWIPLCERSAMRAR